MRSLAVFVSLCLIALPALAVSPYDERLEVSDPNVTTGEFFVGTGFGGFTSNLGSISDLGVTWTLRGGINTHRFFGAELDYQGTSAAVQPIVTTGGFALVGYYFTEQQITADFKLGYPIPAGDQLIRPYVLAGAGYGHIGVDYSYYYLGYHSTDAGAFPFGAGVSYVVVPGLVLDARYTYNLLTASGGNTWNVAFNLGAAFGP